MQGCAKDSGTDHGFIPETVVCPLFFTPDLLLMDPAFVPAEIDAAGGRPIVVCSYEESLQFRQSWVGRTNIILQKPVTAVALLTAVILAI